MIAHRCVLLAGLLGWPVAWTRGQAIAVDQVVSRLGPEVDRAMVAGRIPSAVVALVAGDSVLWTQGFGYANLWARTPATPTTVYLIASTFKPMSTLALLQHLDEGKFALDDPVTPYLKGFAIRGEDPSRPVTFRHLLTHTSGLGRAPGGAPVWSDSGIVSLSAYLPTVLELQQPTMQGLLYSNLAFTVVAYLVERFSGLPYRQYLRDRVFDPLEMSSTAFYPTPRMEERLAVPYAMDSLGRHEPAVRFKGADYPSGLVYGTVGDLANWLVVNLNGGRFRGRRLLQRKTLREMHRVQHERFAGPISAGWGDQQTGYGLSWWVRERLGEQLIAHSGSVVGYTAFLVGNLDRRYGFAVLTNGHQAHRHLFRLAERALDLLAEYDRESR